LIVFSNPLSRRNRADPALVTRLRALLGDRGAVVESGDPESLATLARAHRGAPMIAINGGDGTLSRVISALMREDATGPLPAVLPLCGGTMNTIARSVGVVGRPEALLRRALGRTTTTQRAIGSISWGDSPDRVDTAWGSLFGVGVAVGYLEAYYAPPASVIERASPLVGLPGPVRAAWVLGELVGSTLTGGPMAARATAPFVGEMTVDGVVQAARPRVAVLAGTVADLGIGFRPFAGLVENPGHIGVIDVGSTPLALLPDLARIWLGRPIAHPLNQRQGAARVELRSDAPFLAMVDGDILPASRHVTLAVGPTLTWVRPA
jgi:diacylglycerol kinase family enzyme